jgi:hypothetical protein
VNVCPSGIVFQTSATLGLQHFGSNSGILKLHQS